MVQGYYTLQEAAQFLNISVDELKQMAQKSRIRSFQDRGNLRFRIQDIQELGRQRGATSDPDLVLGEASLPPKKGDGPRSPRSPVLKSAGPKTPPREDVPEVFDFEMDDGGGDISLGATEPGSGNKKASKSGPQPKSGTSPRSGIQPRSGNVLQSKVVQPGSGQQPRSGDKPRSGASATSGTQVQKPSSDSDVRLVAGSNEVSRAAAPDSDIKLRDKDSGSKALGGSGTTRKSGIKGGTPPTSNPTVKRASKLGGPRSPQPPDSGVRLVPMDSDSDVKIVGAGDEVPLGASPAGAVGDSNVRLEKIPFSMTPEDVSAMRTDEINLDEEIRKDEERIEKEKPKRPSKVKPKSELKFPTTSPFELSDSDVNEPVKDAAAASEFKDDSSDFDMTPAKDDSSNFDLPISTDSGSDVPALKDDSSDNFKLTPSATADAGGASDDFSLELDEGELDLGGGELKGPASGINLSNPLDAGISLEKKASDDSLEFDLSLEPESTPKPAQMKQLEGDDSSSEFELSLELGDGEAAGKPGKAADDSDSEFELTLDDSSDLSLEPDAPQAKGDPETQDIFESDFDIPALQEDGAEGSATVDTELESSDFDIALDDSELADDAESGSQVVALDEEEVEPALDEDEVEINIEEDGEFGDLEVDEDAELDEEDDTRPARVEVRDKILRPAPWGVLPTAIMLPCVVIMMLVGMVGFEMVQSSVRHRPPGFMTRALHDNLLSGITGVKKL